MILGTGIDAVSIERASKLHGRALEKIFSPSELAEFEALKDAHEDIRAQFLASRFAVKEAYAKARGTGFCETVVPNEISTRKDEKGMPRIVLEGRTLANAPDVRIHLSITHEKPLAIAMVVLEEADAEQEG